MSDQKCSITFMMISTRQYLEDVSMELSPIISYFESRKSEAYVFFFVLLELNWLMSA